MTQKLPFEIQSILDGIIIDIDFDDKKKKYQSYEYGSSEIFIGYGRNKKEAVSNFLELLKIYKYHYDTKINDIINNCEMFLTSK